MIDLLALVSLTLAWLLINKEVALRRSQEEVARLRTANERLRQRIFQLEAEPQQEGVNDYTQ